MHKRKYSILIITVVVLIAAALSLWSAHPKLLVTKTQAKSTDSKTVPSTTKPIFNKSLYSTTDPSSIWIIVNKVHPLTPISYAPTDLVVPNVPLRSPGNDNMHLSAQAAPSLEAMFAAAKAEGLDLMLTSGYRSYAYQVSLYNGYVASMGQTDTDAVSARPGYSEHQTGLAADVEPVSHNCELNVCFATTPEGVWLAANAYKFGFLIRYTSDKTAITGYDSEPWHIRYVGVLLSTEMHDQSIKTLEEFFNIPGGANYN